MKSCIFHIVVLAFTVYCGTVFAADPKDVDQVKGMVALAVYGDALGAPTEGVALGPIVEDLVPVREFYNCRGLLGTRHIGGGTGLAHETGSGRSPGYD